MEQNRYIEFSLNSEDYAIPLLMVREVISVPETTPIPKAPQHFIGIMNLRGQVISVVDLRKKLKIQPKENNKDEAVIIVDFKGVNVGIVVDSINKVLEFSSSEVQSMPELEGEINGNYIQGVYKKAEGLTVLLDLAKCLDIKDLHVIDQKKIAA